MGWNEVKPVNATAFTTPVESGTSDRFYFVHSYHADQVPQENQILQSHYGYSFTCGIQHKNIYGVQFHPEKSHKFGKHFFKQFAELSQC